MTAGRHNLTRRALLGAPFGVPLLGARAWAVSPAPWARALAAFRRAEARLAALPPGASEERFDTLEASRLSALTRLLRTPAPDLPALSLKIDLTVDEEVASLIDAAACLDVLKADGRRLGQVAVAQQPTISLSYSNLFGS